MEYRKMYTIHQIKHQNLEQKIGLKQMIIRMEHAACIAEVSLKIYK